MKTFEIRTHKRDEMLDITPQVAEAIRATTIESPIYQHVRDTGCVQHLHAGVEVPVIRAWYPPEEGRQYVVSAASVTSTSFVIALFTMYACSSVAPLFVSVQLHIMLVVETAAPDSPDGAFTGNGLVLAVITES